MTHSAPTNNPMSRSAPLHVDGSSGDRRRELAFGARGVAAGGVGVGRGCGDGRGEPSSRRGDGRLIGELTRRA
jgi:hypothetical protein